MNKIAYDACCLDKTFLGIGTKGFSVLRLEDDLGYSIEINIKKKFNWFQKKMIKFCFGFTVVEFD